MAVAVSYDIAKLDERMAPPDRLKTQAAQILEPCLVEQMLRRLVLFAFLVNELERARHHEPDALLYAPREVRVRHGIPVDVVEFLS